MCCWCSDCVIVVLCCVVFRRVVVHGEDEADPHSIWGYTFVWLTLVGLFRFMGPFCLFRRGRITTWRFRDGHTTFGPGCAGCLAHHCDGSEETPGRDSSLKQRNCIGSYRAVLFFLKSSMNLLKHEKKIKQNQKQTFFFWYVTMYLNRWKRLQKRLENRKSSNGMVFVCCVVLEKRERETERERRGILLEDMGLCTSLWDSQRIAREKSKRQGAETEQAKRKSKKRYKAKERWENTLVETDHVSGIALKERCERGKGLGVDRVVLVVVETETVGILLASGRVAMNADVLVQVVGAREPLGAVLDGALECWKGTGRLEPGDTSSLFFTLMWRN